MSAALLTVFGPSVVKGVDKAIEGFDWSHFSVKDRKSDNYLHIGIAPSYGQLTSASVKQLDDKLKIMISGTMNALKKVEPTQRTAENIESVMMNNPLLEPDGDRVERADKIIKDGVNFFKFDGSPDRSVVQEVQTWFTNLIKDRDVILSTKIDLKVMSEIVAQSGATITTFFNFWLKTESHSQTLLDVGVLRFPDIDNPHFKLYRIKLTAWSDCTRVVFVQNDKNGITGEYYARKFKPRESVIRGLKEDAKKKAIKEAEDLFK